MAYEVFYMKLGPAIDGSYLAASEQAWGTTIQTSASFSMAAGRLVLAYLCITDGIMPTGITVSGNTLGSFTEIVTASNSGDFMTTSIYAAWTSSSITNEQITASWTNQASAMLYVSGWANVKNPLTLVKNTDYATASFFQGNSNVANVVITPKVTGSLLLGFGEAQNGSTIITPNGGTAVEITYDMINANRLIDAFKGIGTVTSGVAYTLGGTASDASAGQAWVAMELLFN